MFELHANFIRLVGHPFIKRTSGQGRVFSYLKEFELSQFASHDEIRNQQWQRLEKLLRHAYETCPFYRHRLNESDTAPNQVKSWDDFAKIPILEKKHIQSHVNEMISQDWPRDDLIKNQTGGSTGTPISFYLSKDRRDSREAATLRHDRMAGWRVGDKYATLWGGIPKPPPATWKHNVREWLLRRSIQCDTAKLTEDGMLAFRDQINQFRPRIILAYAKALSLFASFLKNRGLDIYRPASIITSAEVLEPSDRELIEDVFGCRVFNRYGCREFSVIASECDLHSGMHIMSEGLYVEIVRDGKPAEPGTVGDIVVTDLRNLAMPMIRYRIGDMGSISSKLCDCGRGLPILQDVGGRVTDFLVGSDGRLVSGVFLATYVVANRPSLGQVQIRQDTPGKICFHVLPSPEFGEADVRYLVEQTKEYLGQDCEVDHQIVEELEKHPSGKFRFSWSTVTPDYLTTASNTR